MSQPLDLAQGRRGSPTRVESLLKGFSPVKMGSPKIQSCAKGDNFDNALTMSIATETLALDEEGEESEEDDAKDEENEEGEAVDGEDPMVCALDNMVKQIGDMDGNLNHAHQVFDEILETKLFLKENCVVADNGFLEKNRDLLHSDTIKLLSSCSCGLPLLFASNILNQFHKPTSPVHHMDAFESHKQSVGTKFKAQLFKLMQQLETPH
ncbi:hypothetical protein U1Q18_014298 [Sarracenia purpurea var. burkii]